MPCYHPIPMWYSKEINKETGKRSLTANYGNAWRPLGRLPETIYVPCGQCVGCRLEYSRQWAMRCVHEFETAGRIGSFLTLTYSPEYLPEDGKIHKDVFQKFMKRLRKKFGNGLRFFACGEYGSNFTHRPHFHIILFGYCPDDLVYFFTDNQGDNIYQSSFISDIWKQGYITVGVNLNIKTAKYCAKYLQKGEDPCLRMSLKPGIGWEAFDLSSLATDKIYIDGTYIKIPNYFLKKLGEAPCYTDIIQNIKDNRVKNALQAYTDISGNIDNLLMQRDAVARGEKVSNRLGVNVLPYKSVLPKNVDREEYAKKYGSFYLERYSVAEFDKLLRERSRSEREPVVDIILSDGSVVSCKRGIAFSISEKKS